MGGENIVKQRRMLKKILTIFLIAILIVSSFPHMNYANEITVEHEEDNVENVIGDVSDNDKENNGNQQKEDISEFADENLILNNKNANEVIKQNDSKHSVNSLGVKNREKTSKKTTSSTNAEDDETDSENDDGTLKQLNNTILASDELEASVTDSVQSTIRYYKNNLPNYSETNRGSHSDFWIYSALWSSGVKDLEMELNWPENQHPWADFTYWSQGKSTKSSSANEDAGIIIASILLGLNPFAFGERDIVAVLLSRQNE